MGRARAARLALVIGLSVVLGYVVAGAPSPSDFRAGEPETRLSALAAPGLSSITSTTSTSTTTASTTTTTSAPVQPRAVRVMAFNSSNVGGAAGRVMIALRRSSGWNMVDPGPNPPAKARETVVLYTPGFETASQAVARDLDLPPTIVQPMTAAPAGFQDADVAILIGDDVARR